MPSRRSVLGTVGIVACSGCLGFMSGKRCLELWTDDRDPFEYFIEETVSYGIPELAQVESDEPETIRTGRILNEGVVEYKGSFYHVDSLGESTETKTELEVALDRGESQTVSENVTVHAYEDLPGVDRAALEPVFTQVGEEIHEDGEVVVATYPDGTEASRLAVNEELWIEWEGRRYSLHVRDRRETEDRLFRHRVEPLAKSREGLRDYLDSKYLIRFDDVSDDERDVLESATDDGYNECHSTGGDFEPAEKRIRSRLDSREPLPGYLGAWYVSFEGERYLLHYTVSTREP